MNFQYRGENHKILFPFLPYPDTMALIFNDGGPFESL